MNVLARDPEAKAESRAGDFTAAENIGFLFFSFLFATDRIVNVSSADSEGRKRPCSPDPVLSTLPLPPNVWRQVSKAHSPGPLTQPLWRRNSLNQILLRRTASRHFSNPGHTRYSRERLQSARPGCPRRSPLAPAPSSWPGLTEGPCCRQETPLRLRGWTTVQ